MKKLFYLIILVLCLASCKSEEEITIDDLLTRTPFIVNLNGESVYNENRFYTELQTVKIKPISNMGIDYSEYIFESVDGYIYLENVPVTPKWIINNYIVDCPLYESEVQSNLTMSYYDSEGHFTVLLNDKPATLVLKYNDIIVGAANKGEGQFSLLFIHDKMYPDTCVVYDSEKNAEYMFKFNWNFYMTFS